MKILNDFEPIPMSASEAAHPFLGAPPMDSRRFEMHLPSSQELLGEVLKRPEHFITKGRFDAGGVFVVDHGDKVVAVERGPRVGVIERREFSSLQQCFEVLLPLFRRFLKAEFNYFAFNLIRDPDLFPRQWRYTTELTLSVLQKSMQSPADFYSAPTRTYPPLADVIAFLLPHEAKLLDDRLSDGPHLVKTRKGYAFRWYERGQTEVDKEFSGFEDALREYLGAGMMRDLTGPRPRFSRLTSLEYNWNEGDPPV